MRAQEFKRLRRYIWMGGLLMAVLYLLLVAGLGGSDYDQAVADHAWKCQMINEGVWPHDPAVHCPIPLDTLALNTVIR